MKVLNILIAIAASCLMLSCAQEQIQGKTEAEILYKEAQDFIKDGRYILANEKLNLLTYILLFFAVAYTTKKLWI